ncbi:Hint domain-containing protein [Pseudotabrizicola sp. L79]|uniref:Hint domain-containing protein n=1 Tax=Pseudotabrizicola sp. L79 TaxID=3118402 RepID=UPI002F9487F6
MPVTSIWMLGESHITVSGGATLDGITQGDGSHLVGRTITLTSPSWQETLIDDNDANFDDNDGNQVLSGTQVIDGVTYSGNTRVEAEYTVVLRDPSTGQTWTVIGYNVVNSNPPYATIEGLAFIGPPASWPPVGTPLVVVSSREGPGASGQPATPYDSYVTPPCFTPGTLIETDLGPRPIETLIPGDLVLTADDGLQPLRYVARTSLPHRRLVAQPQHAPVLVPKGCLGPGQPQRDMLVSPLHCLLLTGAAAELHFAEPELLVPARHLPGTRQLGPHDLPFGAVYLHLVFDQHQIIFAEGAATESFLLGPTVFAGAPPQVQADLRRLFPAIATDQGTGWQTAARPMLRAWEARTLAA